MARCVLPTPFWVKTLATAERGGGVIRAAVKLLKKGSGVVREAVGKSLVEKMRVAVEVRDFEVVLGLVKFLNTEMERDEDGRFPVFLDEARACVEQGLSNLGAGEEEEKLLESARDLLRVGV